MAEDDILRDLPTPVPTSISLVPWGQPLSHYFVFRSSVGTVKIGRGDPDQDQSGEKTYMPFCRVMSRKHAFIRWDNGAVSSNLLRAASTLLLSKQIVIGDAGSRHGTYLNGERTPLEPGRTYALQDADKITFGKALDNDGRPIFPHKVVIKFNYTEDLPSRPTRYRKRTTPRPSKSPTPMSPRPRRSTYSMSLPGTSLLESILPRKDSLDQATYTGFNKKTEAVPGTGNSRTCYVDEALSDPGCSRANNANLGANVNRHTDQAHKGED
ncbi:hypothetical protein FRC17_008399 [Serendipita sp. 399]|nr:hypothetical protein FRC17_008399 [Serendipita sp. 399]